MLKKHVIAIEQIDGNASAICDKPSDFDMNESLASFTNAFQTGNVTLSSSMNESLSPSIDTSTRRTNNKPQLRINNESEESRSMEPSLEETAKEPKTTPRRTTIPKRRHSFSSPSANTPYQLWKQLLETFHERLKTIRPDLTEGERKEVIQLLATHCV